MLSPDERAAYQGTPASDFVCQYCGQSGGEPVEVASREFQGDEAHGGIVTWIDHGCTLCVKERD